MVDDSPFRSRPPISTADALVLLEHAEVEILGRMPYSSNATFLVDLNIDGETPAQAIYKPERGERPLSDFPPNLYKREVAAFLLSEQLGWGQVPPTIECDGPLDIGSLQLFVPSDFEQHYFTMIDDATRHDDFRQICAFDLIANNTDRKSGHVLLGEDNRIWAIDNGLSFHRDFKVRTVIWEFAGEELPDDVNQSVLSLIERGLDAGLAALLDPTEAEAVLDRARSLLAGRHFPTDPTGRRYPWPIV